MPALQRVQNGSDSKYGFDGFGRLVQQSGLSTPIRPDSFKYDVLGNRTQQGDFTYAYDPVYKRLTRRTLIGNESCKIDYAYDADGNLLRTVPADSTVCTDAGWDNVYRPDTMVYDGSGRMVSRVRWLPRSDLRPYGRRDPYTFWYDALGRRIFMFSGHYAADDKGPTYYFWLDNQVVYKANYPAVSQLDEGIVNWVWPVLGRRTADTLQTGNGQWFFYGPGIDKPLYAVTSLGLNKQRFFHRDYRGSIIAVTTPTDSTLPLAPSSYEPFGAPVGTNADAAETNAGFNGHDANGGLVYMRNRWYDPNTGRFTQEDPIGFAGGINLYGYAAGDPITYSDPFGLCVPSCGAIAASAVGYSSTGLAYMFDITKADALFTMNNFSTALEARALVGQAHNVALSHMIRTYGEPAGVASMNNGAGDALRHALGGCLLAREFGSDVAEEIGDNHESDPENDPREKKMDDTNNAVGRALSTLEGSCFDNSIRALEGGGLVTTLPK